MTHIAPEIVMFTICGIVLMAAIGRLLLGRNQKQGLIDYYRRRIDDCNRKIEALQNDQTADPPRFFWFVLGAVSIAVCIGAVVSVILKL